MAQLRCAGCGAPITEQDQVCPECDMDLGLAMTFLISRGPAATPVPASSAPKPPPQPGTAGATLILRRGSVLTDISFPLGQRAIIGRSDPVSGPVDVDMSKLPEAIYLSRHHAEVWRDASGKWFIKDLGSQNGIFVRPSSASQFKKVVEDTRINDGDEVAFGNAHFEFRT